jgi:hypothetical protein
MRGSHTTVIFLMLCYFHEELDEHAVSALRRAISELKQRWSVIGWLTRNLLSPPCFRRHFKPLVTAALAVISTHQPALDLRGGLWPSLCVIHEEGLLGLFALTFFTVTHFVTEESQFFINSTLLLFISF